MQTLKNSRVQSALLLGGLLLALFSACAPRPAAAQICLPAGCTGLTLSPPSQTAYVQPGQTYTFTYVLTNTGPDTRPIQLKAVSQHSWPTSLQPYKLSMKAFSSVDVLLKVAVPPSSQTCICLIEDEVVISTDSFLSRSLGQLYLTNLLPVPALR